MTNGTENSWNFQISRKKEVDQKIYLEMNFSKIAVPLDSVPEFLNILVQRIVNSGIIFCETYQLLGEFCVDKVSWEIVHSKISTGGGGRWVRQLN